MKIKKKLRKYNSGNLKPQAQYGVTYGKYRYDFLKKNDTNHEFKVGHIRQEAKLELDIFRL